MKMEDELGRPAEAAPTQPYEQSFNGSSSLTDFIRARARRLWMSSRDEPTHNAVLPQKKHTRRLDIYRNKTSIIRHQVRRSITRHRRLMG